MAYILITALILLCVYFYFLFHKLEKKHAADLIQQESIYSNSLNEREQHSQTIAEKNKFIFEEITARYLAQRQELETRLRAEFAESESKIRKDAVERAKYVNKGFDGETFSPLLQKSWLATDFRHIGAPIDYLVISGASLVTAGLEEDIESITLLEVKTGNADMNKVQRRIRDAVVQGKVQFGLYNPETQITRIWSPNNPAGKI